MNIADQKNVKSNPLSKVWVVWLLALLCCTLWGSAYPCIKTGYRLFGIAAGDSASQIVFAGSRFFLAGAQAILFGSIKAGIFLKIRKGSLYKILLLALFQTILQYTLFYTSLARTTAVNGSIIDGTVNFFSILFAALLFRIEKLTPGKIIGCILGFAGIVLVNLNGGAMSFHFGMGDLLMLGAAASSGMATVFLKIFSEEENPAMLSGWQFLIGGAVMTATGFAAGGRLHPVSPIAFLLLIYMALISSVAYTLWGVLLRYNPVSLIGVFGFMTPVFGVLLSALFLREDQTLGAFTLAALALVCLGIWQVQRQKS